MQKTTVRIPQISSIETALKLYYQKTELNNSEIRELFGEISNATIWRLKRLAKEKMVERDIPSWNAQCVNTTAAYVAWGLDIEDLEHRYKKLKEISA